ncbi:hypothetical protein KKA14_09925 [bacterium]|nr:hypothetical protein [bacterium]
MRLKNLSLFLFLLVVVSCAKVHTYEAVFYPEKDVLSNYQKIVIHNLKKGDFVSDLMENALKAQFTDINAMDVNTGKSDETLIKEVKAYAYNPKIEKLPENKIAYLSFDISAAEDIKREGSRRLTTLQSCNYLLKTNPCRTTGTEFLASGNQIVNISLKGKISLKNSAGENIVADSPFSENISDSGRVIKSPLNLIFEANNKIAKEYAKNLIPHRESVTVEFLGGGDSTAITLIQNKAYNKAIQHLNRIISKDEKPEAADLFHMGIAYEALSDLIPAADYYYKAKDIEPGDENISKAMKRLKRVKR